MALIEYWPEFMAGLTELQALAQAEQPELTAALEAVRRAPEDFFITTLTEHGAERWELMLKLPIAHGGDLDDRRFRIMTWIAEQRPFTLTRLRELLATLCGEGGYSAVVIANAFTLKVRVALTAKQNYDDVTALLERVVPVNMCLDLDLLYNRYQTLTSLTYGQMAGYTYQQLRSEVI